MIFGWGHLQFLGKVVFLFWVKSSAIFWLGWPLFGWGCLHFLGEFVFIPHNANCVFCRNRIHQAHIVPALSLGAVTSLLSFWTSKHRLILHRHTSKRVRKASPTVAWAFNTVTHIFSHPGHIFQLILCTLETSWAELGLSQAGTVSLELKLCLIGLASWG